jgi:transposase
LRAKTDKLDATTIAHVLLSAEARPGYVPSELVASYRELVRLHTQLSDEVARYKNEIHALLQVLFPEFSQVFADPCRPTALAVLERYRSRPGHRFGWGGIPRQTAPPAGSAQLWAAHRRAPGDACSAIGEQWAGCDCPCHEPQNPL